MVCSKCGCKYFEAEIIQGRQIGTYDSEEDSFLVKDVEVEVTNQYKCRECGTAIDW